MMALLQSIHCVLTLLTCTIIPQICLVKAVETHVLGHRQMTNNDPVTNSTATIPGLWADPHIAVFDKNYYIYPTKDGYPEDPESGRTYYVWKSADLVNWERSARPILTYNGTASGATGDVPWATIDAWAPSILEKEGTYYFYHSGFNPAYSERSIGVSTAPSPEGPFTPAPQPFITNTEEIFTNVAIDPHVFQDPVSGKAVIFWGNGRPQYAEMEDDLLSHRVATTKQLCGLTNYLEAPFMVYRKGLYHMTYSVNVTTSPVYRVGYATSTNLAGPFEYRGEILTNDRSQGILGTGHNSILNVPGTDNWYMVYHRWAPEGTSTNLRREIVIDKLLFDSDTGFIQKIVTTRTGNREPVTVP